jgi:putative transposase
MAHQPDADVVEAVVQLLCENGFGSLAEAVRILLNEAMRTERAHVLGAAEYERRDKRRGYANGFKPKTIETRLGAITVQVPQVRGDIDFYPSARAREGANGH